MFILVLDENIQPMQHLTMNLENLSLKLIITDRHIVLQKNCLVYGKNGKIDHMQHLPMDLENLRLKLIITKRNIVLKKK